MSFYQELESATAADRAELLANPLFADAMAGRVTLPMYVGFLTQAYHHVKHTVPLMMACGARLGEDQEGLRGKLVHYVEEEYGHHEWILDDIRACGADAEAVRVGKPSVPTELMVAYAYDFIQRRNPVGFFGMVHVLEGTSVALASQAAVSLGTTLRLPKKAFSYLSSHGALDVEHTAFFRELVDQLIAPRDRADLVHAAAMFYRLYGAIFHQLHQEFRPCNSMAVASS